MEILLEYRGSRRQLTVASSETVLDVVAGELRRAGRRQACVVTADADLSEPREGKLFILQKWSAQWECYVDVRESGEVGDGDRLGVVAKPKPPSRLMRLCCCGCAARADEERHRKAVGSMLSGVRKNEEIQSLDYKFNVESELSSHTSEWESQSLQAAVDPSNDAAGEAVDEYVRADSGRASWRLVPSKKPLAHSQLDTGTADSSSNSSSCQDNNNSSRESSNEPANEGANRESSNEPANEGTSSKHGDEEVEEGGAGEETQDS